MNDKLLIDTNVLVYAHDRDSSRYVQASEILKTALASRQAVLSAQNLTEFCRVILEKTSPRAEYETARKFARDLSNSAEIITYNGNTIDRAVEISEKHKLHFFDSLLAATMAQENISTIVTENDRDFRKIPWLKVINPFKKRA
ncbi:TPA: PIN domain-containing protein [Candidatus Micrarchaeota archaeon]|nr:PIN domain-containing protein [Candidatus Micrarchaeota archaeon]